MLKGAHTYVAFRSRMFSMLHPAEIICYIFCVFVFVFFSSFLPLPSTQSLCSFANKNQSKRPSLMAHLATARSPFSVDIIFSYRLVLAALYNLRQSMHIYRIQERDKGVKVYIGGHRALTSVLPARSFSCKLQSLLLQRGSR